MGDNLLMKSSIIILSIFVSTLLLSSELSWVDKQVEAIKPSRKGMNIRDFRQIKDPFIFLEKNRTKEKSEVSKAKASKQISSSNSQDIITEKTQTVSRALTLTLIMNNTAMIDNQWYKVGDKVHGYKIIQINRKSVLLIKNKKQILLSTKSTSTKLHFKNK